MHLKYQVRYPKNIFCPVFMLSLGPMIETIIAACQTKEDQVKWLEMIQKQSALLPQHTSTPSQIIKEKPK
jgi:hypothetical protein